MMVFPTRTWPVAAAKNRWRCSPLGRGGPGGGGGRRCGYRRRRAEDRRRAPPQIDNSRRAVYGYDQRVEVFGSLGAARAENRTPTSVEISTETATRRDNPLHFFLERYQDAYRLELDRFVDVLKGEPAPYPGGEDGRAALRLADALVESHRTGAPVGL